MDLQTIESYDEHASDIAAQHASLMPTRIYKLINEFFTKDGTSVDVGCGIGRDSAWLAKHGYSVCGIDASMGMLQQAINCYPQIKFTHDSLPLLKKISDCTFTNVLCSAVIMHLASDQIANAVANLVRITTQNGIIIVSFRGTKNEGKRENGKLYTLIEANKLIYYFIAQGSTLLLHEIDHEEARDLIWCNLVFKKLLCPVV